MKSEIEDLLASLPGSRLCPDERNKNVLNVVISNGKRDVLWLTFDDGELWTKNSEDDEIQVMLDVAAMLGGGARVRGDEFETFRTPTETFIHPDDQLEIQKARESARRLRKIAQRKQWILNFCLILFFAGLALLAIYFS